MRLFTHALATLVLLVAMTLQLTGCGTTRSSGFSPGSDGAPTENIDVTNIPNATPKKEPFSKYGNPKSYVVNGQRYYVKSTFVGYNETGIASWYGTKFHDKRTSSGEPYNLGAMTAAHKTLPIPCYVRVTNLTNGKEVIVKVNDRGPFHENRIIDLSYVAAKKLGVFPKGTALVRVTAINPGESSVAEEAPMGDDIASTETATPVAAKPLGHTPRIYMQVGAFGSQENAERLMKQVKMFTTSPVTIKTGELHGKPIYRVHIGPLKSVDNSDELLNSLEKANLGKPITVIE